MKRVTGIGGVFFKARDPKALGQWYKTHLGVDVQAWGGAKFPWKQPDQPEADGLTVWSVFSETSKHFEPSTAPFMINYIVDDLDTLVVTLKTEGIEILDMIDQSEYGKFAWVIDPEGNKVELWQPASKA